MPARETRCPKCAGLMQVHTFSDGISLLRCKSCHGMLLEQGMLETIRGAVRADEFFDVGHPKVGRALDGLQDYACPGCGARMQGAPDADQRHIRVEKCSGCGALFLDAGELLDLSHDTPLERLWAMLTEKLGLI